MGAVKTRKDFQLTEEGKELRTMLEQMARDNSYNTTSSYSSNAELYPDGQMPFVDKHMNYIMCHPALEVSKYLANIKLITRRR